MRLAKAYPRAWRFPAYRRSKQEVETSGEREKAEGRERRGSYDPLKTSLFEPARHVDDVGCSRHFECNSTNAVHFMTANFLLFFLWQLLMNNWTCWRFCSGEGVLSKKPKDSITAIYGRPVQSISSSNSKRSSKAHHTKHRLLWLLLFYLLPSVV